MRRRRRNTVTCAIFCFFHLSRPGARWADGDDVDDDGDEAEDEDEDEKDRRHM